MILYNFSSGDTLGVSSGKLWTRIVMFDRAGRQCYVEKYYTPIINLNHLRSQLTDLTIDCIEPNDEVLCERIINQIKKTIELL